MTTTEQLVKAAREFVTLFRGSDMRPEDECHELYGQFRSALAWSSRFHRFGRFRIQTTRPAADLLRVFGGGT